MIGWRIPETRPGRLPARGTRPVQEYEGPRHPSVYAELKGYRNSTAEIKAWLERMGNRPAVQRSYAIGKELNTVPTVTEDAKSVLFGQGRR